jgi:hypothetical protein
MTVIADTKKRVVLPKARPGDRFDLKAPGEGTFVLTRLGSGRARSAQVKVVKRRGYTVGVLNRPINEAALREALAEFP